MNKQLERELQTNIQSLKSNELANILSHFEKLLQHQIIKTIHSNHPDI